ncbi:MAG: hypothetical protein GY944_05140, partial [bacterium]|nr:hypothetical protein [bacterium]
MLDRIRKGQRWMTAIFVFAIGIVFVFFLGLGGSTPGGGGGSNPAEDVVVLDDAHIRMSDYLRVRKQQEERLRGSLGDQFDPSAMSSFLDAQALQAVVSQMVMSQSAVELGLVVDTEEVKNWLRHGAGFRDEKGRFDQEEFDAFAKWEYGGQANFLTAVQRDLLQQKMLELVYSQVEIGNAEALGAARYRTEEARIAFVALDADRLPKTHRPDGAADQAYLEANREALEARYETEADRFMTPERVVMRHILFKHDPGSEEGAPTDPREEAEQVLERLKAG